MDCNFYKDRKNLLKNLTAIEHLCLNKNFQNQILFLNDFS